jgi:hypothetical protein
MPHTIELYTIFVWVFIKMNEIEHDLTKLKVEVLLAYALEGCNISSWRDPRDELLRKVALQMQDIGQMSVTGKTLLCSSRLNCTCCAASELSTSDHSKHGGLDPNLNNLWWLA